MHSLILVYQASVLSIQYYDMFAKLSIANIRQFGHKYGKGQHINIIDLIDTYSIVNAEL